MTAERNCGGEVVMAGDRRATLCASRARYGRPQSYALRQPSQVRETAELRSAPAVPGTGNRRATF